MREEVRAARGSLWFATDASWEAMTLRRDMMREGLEMTTRTLVWSTGALGKTTDGLDVSTGGSGATTRTSEWRTARRVKRSRGRDLMTERAEKTTGASVSSTDS